MVMERVNERGIPWSQRASTLPKAFPRTSPASIETSEHSSSVISTAVFLVHEPMDSP